MIFYLTYNDLPSGIFSSQVIDVVKYISAELNTPVKLVSFISLRSFNANRKKIKADLPDSLVLPMFPGVHRWRRNLPALKIICRIFKPSAIIGRSVLATELALKTGLKTAYDGRGAIAAEWREYAVVQNKNLISQIAELEKHAVNAANANLAVSGQLLLHWQKQFGYTATKHVIIPCTLNSAFETIELSEVAVQHSRKKTGVNQTDVVFAYSGSLAGWQSFDLLYNFIKPVLSAGKKDSVNKLLLLCDRDSHVIKLEKEFPGQVICKKVAASLVPEVLIAADYGLLVREESVTNKVASPVKFAEYIACGLKVIISENLGDYSDLVIKENLGFIAGSNAVPAKVDLQTKMRLRQMALEKFTKHSFKTEYSRLLSWLT